MFLNVKEGPHHGFFKYPGLFLKTEKTLPEKDFNGIRKNMGVILFYLNGGNGNYVFALDIAGVNRFFNLLLCWQYPRCGLYGLWRGRFSLSVILLTILSEVPMRRIFFNLDFLMGFPVLPCGAGGCQTELF